MLLQSRIPSARGKLSCIYRWLPRASMTSPDNTHRERSPRDSSSTRGNIFFADKLARELYKFYSLWTSLYNKLSARCKSEFGFVHQHKVLVLFDRKTNLTTSSSHSFPNEKTSINTSA